MVGQKLVAPRMAKRRLLSRRQKEVFVHCQAEITRETEPRAPAVIGSVNSNSTAHQNPFYSYSEKNLTKWRYKRTHSGWPHPQAAEQGGSQQAEGLTAEPVDGGGGDAAAAGRRSRRSSVAGRRGSNRPRPRPRRARSGGVGERRGTQRPAI